MLVTDPTPEEIAVRETLFYSRAHIKLVEKWVDAAVAAEREPYREYITFLEKACGNAETFRAVHGIVTSDKDVAEGERLRAAIRRGPEPDSGDEWG